MLKNWSKLFLSQRVLKFSDIESTHRIGRTGGHYRPVIVQFQSVDHKLSAIRDQDLRVSTALTPRQRGDIHSHGQVGSVAYFRSVRLHVEDRPAGSKDCRVNRPQSLRGSQGKEVFRLRISKRPPFYQPATESARAQQCPASSALPVKTGLGLPGTKGTSDNGTNITGAVRNTVSLGTDTLTTVLDKENGHKALTVALPGGKWDRHGGCWTTDQLQPAPPL